MRRSKRVAERGWKARTGAVLATLAICGTTSAAVSVAADHPVAEHVRSAAAPTTAPRVVKLSTTSAGGPVSGESYAAAASGDGRTAVFVSSAAEFGGDPTNLSVVLVDVPTGRRETIAHTQEGYAVVAVSGDGSTVAFTQPDPDVGMTYAVYHRNERSTQVVRDPETTWTGRHPMRVSPGANMYLAQDGSKLLLERPVRVYSEVVLYDLASGTLETLSLNNQETESYWYDYPYGLSAAATHAYFVSDSSNLPDSTSSGSGLRVFRRDIAGKRTSEVLLPGPWWSIRGMSRNGIHVASLGDRSIQLADTTTGTSSTVPLPASLAPGWCPEFSTLVLPSNDAKRFITETCDVATQQRGALWTFDSSGGTSSLLASSGVSATSAYGDLAGATFLATDDAFGESDGHRDAYIVTLATQCANYVFIGIRGSGQTSLSYGGFGREVDAVRRGFVAQLGTTATVREIALDYPSAPVTDLIPKNGHITYFKSIDAGVNLLKEQIKKSIADCPQDVVVVAGYSQGALVANLVVREWNTVGAVVLVADPARVTNQGGINLGTATPGNGAYILKSQTTGPLPATLNSKVVQLCDASDLVCDFSHVFDDLVAAAATHNSYEDLALVRAGAIAAVTAKGDPPGLSPTPTPTVTGTLRVGYRLTSNPGTWGPPPVALTYQWFRSGTAIPGATASSYLLGATDRGKTIVLRVTGNKVPFKSISRTSATIGPIAAGTLSTATPTVTGTLKVGYRLTSNPGTWGPPPVAVTHQWFRSGTAIPGATASTYFLLTTDRNRTLTVRVTGTKTGYTSAARTSAPTGSIR